MIAAVVLAAGAGTRFGGTKQIEVLRGKPLAQHAIDAAAAAGVEEIVVVLGHDAERVRSALDLSSGARVVLNEGWAAGQASSLAVGLKALDRSCEAAVVLLADQPGIAARHVASLIETYRRGHPRIVRIAFDEDTPIDVDRRPDLERA